jgi:hypothetical protein
MIMIHHQRRIYSTNNTFVCGGFKFFERFVRNHCPKLTSVDATSVRCAANPTPTIKPIPLFVVRWEKLRGAGFFVFATCAGQQFHALRDNALRVGFPFSSFIGPGIPDILAQKETRRPLSFSVLGCGAGGFKPGLPGLALL